MKEIGKQKKDNYFIFTSNIDSQFQRAGFDENKIYECHGSLAFLQCSEEAATDECEDLVWPLDVNQLPKVNQVSSIRI